MSDVLCCRTGGIEAAGRARLLLGRRPKIWPSSTEQINTDSGGRRRRRETTDEGTSQRVRGGVGVRQSRACLEGAATLARAAFTTQEASVRWLASAGREERDVSRRPEVDEVWLGGRVSSLVLGSGSDRPAAALGRLTQIAGGKGVRAPSQGSACTQNAARTNLNAKTVA